MGKSEAPTLFQVNGPVGLASWKDYCYDLTGSDILNELTSDKFELKNGDEIAGVGYCTETYGLIYNKALLKKAGYTQDDIKSFADLKKVAEDITKRKDELGFSAFTSAGTSSGVRPIEVSTHSPFNTALTDAPFPRCATIILLFFRSSFRYSAHALDTKLWLVPWNPYLLTLYFS